MSYGGGYWTECHLEDADPEMLSPVHWPEEQARERPCVERQLLRGREAALQPGHPSNWGLPDTVHAGLESLDCQMSGVLVVPAGAQAPLVSNLHARAEVFEAADRAEFSDMVQEVGGDCTLAATESADRVIHPDQAEAEAEELRNAVLAPAVQGSCLKSSRPLRTARAKRAEQESQVVQLVRKLPD